MYELQEESFLEAMSRLMQETASPDAVLFRFLVELAGATRSEQITLYRLSQKNSVQTVSYYCSPDSRSNENSDARRQVVELSDDAGPLFLAISRSVYSFTQSEIAYLKTGALLLESFLRQSALSHRLEQLDNRIRECESECLSYQDQARRWKASYLRAVEYTEGLTRRICKTERRLEAVTRNIAGKLPNLQIELEPLHALTAEVSNFTRRLARDTVASTKVPLREPLNLNQVVWELIERYKPLFEERKTRFERGRLPNINVYREAVTTILEELLLNAVIHGRQGGIVRLDYTHSVNEHHFVVEDDGNGIDPDLREKAFAPFYKLARPGSESRDGLGLYTCKRLVESMGGNIWISGNRSGGCAVHCTVPRD